MSRQGGVEPREARPSRPSARPAELCRALLDALEAAEGRRRRRRRDTTPDALGLAMKRELLLAATREDPAPAAFEGWLLQQCLRKGAGEGGWRAVAMEIWQDWLLAERAPSFGEWLRAGAPSEDRMAADESAASDPRVPAAPPASLNRTPRAGGTAG